MIDYTKPAMSGSINQLFCSRSAAGASSRLRVTLSCPRSGLQTRSGPTMTGVEPHCLVELFANCMPRNTHAARALRHLAGISSAPKVRHVCCFFGVVPVSCFSSKFGGV